MIGTELDGELQRRCADLAAVERAVASYRRRCENDEWPDWIALLPAEFRDAVADGIEDEEADL